MNNKLQKYIIHGIILVTLLGFFACRKKIGNYGNTEMYPQLNPASPQITSIVIAEGGLNARDVPSQEGKVAFLIPNYSMVEPSEEVGEEMEIKNKKGK